MPVPPIDEVKDILEDFELRLRQILEGAWEDWQTMSHRAILSPRSRASIIFDFIRTRALADFDGDANIRAIPKGQTVHFLIRDRVLMRFKKANSAGLGSNIETQAVIEFVDPQLPLFELPPVYHIEVCYHLDKLATRMALLAVTARQRNTKLWAYELDRPAVGGTGTVVWLPDSPATDGTPPEVRPRKPIDKPNTGRGE
jgi:hypothetical protein